MERNDSFWAFYSICSCLQLHLINRTYVLENTKKYRFGWLSPKKKHILLDFFFHIWISICLNCWWKDKAENVKAHLYIICIMMEGMFVPPWKFPNCLTSELVLQPKWQMTCSRDKLYFLMANILTSQQENFSFSSGFKIWIETVLKIVCCWWLS